MQKLVFAIYAVYCNLCAYQSAIYENEVFNLFNILTYFKNGYIIHI